MKIYEFNNAPGKPLINLAYANGFLPQTYTRALKPLFADYRVVSIHARPMWDDCPPDSFHNWTQFGDDLLEGLDSLTDKPVIGIGHSMGGLATMYAAVKRPGRFSKIILLDPTFSPPPYLWIAGLIRAVGLGHRLPLVQGALRRRREWESVEAAYASFRKKALFSRFPDDVLRAYAESITTPSTNGNGKGGVRLAYSPEWESRIYQTIPTDVWRLPGKINVPILIIRGELTDVFVGGSVAAFRRANPGAQITTLAGVGHFVPQESPEQTGQAIAEFVGKPSR